MKRLRRWLICALAGASLAMAIMCMWVRSYWVGDQFAWSDQRSIVGFNSYRGRFCIYHGTRFLHSRDPDGFYHLSAPATMDAMAKILPPRFRSVDLIYSDTCGLFNEDEWGTQYRGVIVPAWLCFIFTLYSAAFWPLRAFELFVHAKWREERKQRQGVCPTCGYDLRATPDRCPECGTIPPSGTILSK